MSFNGSGTYSLPGAALNTGDTVSATENNTLRNDMATAFNKTLCRDGQATPTANLPMGGFKLTGLGNATTAGDALPYGQSASISQAMLAANVAGNGPAFSAYPSGTFTVSPSTFTVAPCNTEEFDTASVFNNTGGTVGGIPAYSFQPTVAGYYQINGCWSLGAATTFTRSLCAVYKNGSLFKQGLDNNGTLATGSNVSALVYLNGTTDYVSFYIFQAGTGTITINAGPGSTYFQASMVRSA